MPTNSYYEVAVGQNNQAGLVKINPQPRTGNLHYPAYIVDGNLQGDFDGSLFTDLEWSGAITIANWNNVISQFGFSDTVFSGPVTLTLLRHDRSTWHHFNGNALILEYPNWQFKLTSFKIRCIALVEVT